ncbi:ester cyclase [Celeribacter neptunius]|uniref:SnoaL-like polyketide cyclase n=1 Tax=Celeribacter neptunius TaxID=588602 RepID=A0A1I3P3B4_9RHOB|nr:ester cyclase [Celeribacter neptunius]SFJ15919.1 SnoaL-like polyketide cyclase [Celeribacter neptunius]
MKYLDKTFFLAASLSALALAPLSARADETMSAAALAELAQHQAEDARIADNLAKFDTLDFEVFTGQKWDRLHESHAEDILVHWPDGHTTTGLDVHIADLAGMFVYAPDTRIEQHPIRIGQGEWTGVVGVIEGTFTEPMPIGDGQFIQPTGKAYKLTMATVGHWTGEGVMDEEYLFWDNLSFMKQLGLME